jgi:hypothetical protein
MNLRNVHNLVRPKHQPSLRIELLEGRKLMCADAAYAASDLGIATEDTSSDAVLVGSEIGISTNNYTVLGAKVGGGSDRGISLPGGLTTGVRDWAFADVGDHVSVTGGLAGGIGGDSIFRSHGDVQPHGRKLGAGMDRSDSTDVDVAILSGLAGGIEGSGIVGRRIGEEIPT